MLRRLGVPSVLIGLIIGLATGGTAIWAAIPDRPTGAITACYPTSGPNQGRLAVIDAAAGENCAAGEAALTWQQQTFCAGFPHPGVDWSIPGSTPGNGCYFAGIYFPTSDATNANFTNANLSHTAMYAIKVSGANFTGTNLTDAVVGRGFSNVDLRSAYAITGIYLGGVGMSRWDMSKLNLSRARIRGSAPNANFTNTNLTNATFDHGIVTGAVFTGANLNGADVNATGFTSADLHAARIVTNVQLSGAIRHAQLVDWDFSGLNLAGASFLDANLSGANFTNANLTHARNLKSANLTAVNWTRTTCPDGTNSAVHQNTCVGHL